MTEHPILFTGPMVRALLESRKTMTRRIIKPQPEWVIIRPEDKPEMTVMDGKYGAVWYIAVQTSEDGDVDFSGQFVPCPYGQPGDRLWVKETWRVGAWNEDGNIAVDYLADGYIRREWLPVEDTELFVRLWQQSTDDAIKAIGQRERYEWNPGSSPCRHRPSIFMPRWASRINLEITAIRVERVQDISEDDAKAEGSDKGFEMDVAEFVCGVPIRNETYRTGFRLLWDSINAKRGYGWDANPWTWVIEFKRVDL